MNAVRFIPGSFVSSSSKRDRQPRLDDRRREVVAVEVALVAEHQLGRRRGADAPQPLARVPADAPPEEVRAEIAQAVIAGHVTVHTAGRRVIVAIKRCSRLCVVAVSYTHLTLPT